MSADILSLIPLPLLQVYAFILGVVIGSFLNVYIYRFHTGKSLSGKSHCLSCGTSLKPIELIPLLSYLGLRGKCRSCGCRIPSRYFLVELTTGLLFLWALTLTQNLYLVLILWFLLSVLLVITVYDMYHFIIPDVLTIVVGVGVAAWYVFEWSVGRYEFMDLVTDIMAASIGVLFFWVLWWYSKGRWIGFGDVKLSFPLGWWVGANSVFSFVVLSFWIGAIASLLLIGGQYLLARGKHRWGKAGAGLTMKSAVPFAPFLVASSVFIIFTQFNVLSLFQSF